MAILGDTTEGTLLAGRIRYAQPRYGYRTGIEPVLLAAAIPALPGQTVLEAGVGAGAGLLCLAHRVPRLDGFGIERDPVMAALARSNLAANAVPYTIITAGIETPPALPSVDHAFANPPWHDPASTHPPGRRRAAATHRGPAGLRPGLGVRASTLRPGGTLTLALTAALAHDATALLHAAGLGRITLVPLWPRPGRPAKLVLLQARHGAGPLLTAPGLVLHDDAGYTAEADAILRAGAPFVPRE